MRLPLAVYWYTSRSIAGSSPGQFAQGSQSSSNGTIEVKNLRPITVMSSFWRIWAAMWLQSAALQTWRQQYIPACVAGAKGGLGAEDLAARLQTSFAARNQFLSVLITVSVTMLCTLKSLLPCSGSWDFQQNFGLCFALAGDSSGVGSSRSDTPMTKGCLLNKLHRKVAPWLHLFWDFG